MTAAFQGIDVFRVIRLTVSWMPRVVEDPRDLVNGGWDAAIFRRTNPSGGLGYPRKGSRVFGSQAVAKQSHVGF